MISNELARCSSEAVEPAITQRPHERRADDCTVGVFKDAAHVVGVGDADAHARALCTVLAKAGDESAGCSIQLRPLPRVAHR